MSDIEPKQSAQDIIAEMMLAERYEKLKKESAAKANFEMKKAQRDKTDAALAAKDERNYANCDHLQGNHKRGEIPQRKVSALNHHTFHNKVARYHCTKCGFKWFKQDTKKHLLRNGKKVPNPTKMSYADAQLHTMTNSGYGQNKPSKAFMRVTYKEIATD